MRKLIVLLSAIIFTAVACKKSSSTNTTNNTNQNTNGIPYGVLNATRSFNIISPSSLGLPINTGTAYFLTNTSNLTSMINVGNVAVNGIKFSWQSASKMYIDSTYMLTINPTSWQVIGLGSIASFTYTNNDSLPKYSGYALLPDTIYKSQTQNLQINGVSGADIIQIRVMDATGHLAIYSVNPVSTNNTVTISASSLSAFTSGGSGSMAIDVQKNNNQPFSSKTFRFISDLQLSKTVYIK